LGENSRILTNFIIGVNVYVTTIDNYCNAQSALYCMTRHYKTFFNISSNINVLEGKQAAMLSNKVLNTAHRRGFTLREYDLKMLAEKAQYHLFAGVALNAIVLITCTL